MNARLRHVGLVMVGMFLVCIQYVFAEFKAMSEGSRKENKEGDILVSYDREGTDKYITGAVLSFPDGQTRYNPLPIKRCVEFVDAKLVSRSNQLAVVFVDGLYLIYQRYNYTNQNWLLVQDVKLAEYSTLFTIYGNCLELSDSTTLKSSFIKKDGQFVGGDSQKSHERVGDNAHFIHVTDTSTVIIDNEEQKQRQLHLNISPGDSGVIPVK